jgi:hypothetical protein
MLPAIRTDSTITKATRAKQFLADYEPKCKAMEDYEVSSQKLLELLKGELDVRQLPIEAQVQA